MADVHTFLVFLAAALLVALTPGPGIFYVPREHSPAAGAKALHRASGSVLAVLCMLPPAPSVSRHWSWRALKRSRCLRSLGPLTSSGLGSRRGEKPASSSQPR